MASEIPPSKMRHPSRWCKDMYITCMLHCEPLDEARVDAAELG